jgi:phospholipid N-methyltransferase
MSNNNYDRRLTQTEDEFILADLLQMNSAVNYTQWLYSMIHPFLGKKVLEVGAGIGNLTNKIIKDVDQLIAVEPNAACQKLLRQAFQNHSKFSLIPQRIEVSQSLNEFQDKIDTILCVNVLEHIQNDAEILKVFNNLLSTDGRLVLIVPAVKWVYGEIDKAVGHYRRYSKKSINYFNFPGLIVWFFNSRFLKIHEQQQSQIAFFDRIVPLIKNLESFLHPPLGMSLFVVGRKNE